jgi:hypothetical protein
MTPGKNKNNSLSAEKDPYTYEYLPPNIVRNIFNKFMSPRNAARLKAVSTAFRQVGPDSKALREDWMRVKTNVGRALDKKWRLRNFSSRLGHSYEKAVARAFGSIVRVGGDVPASARNPLLVLAARYGRTDVVKLLLDRDEVDIEAKDDSLLGAAEKGHTETVKLLLNRGANVEGSRQWHGRTALLLAAEEGHAATVKLLLDRGANIEAKVNDGKTYILPREGPYLRGSTALMLAAKNGHTATVKLLLDRGAKMYARARLAKNEVGMTALSWARKRGHLDIVQMLQEQWPSASSRNRR